MIESQWEVQVLDPLELALRLFRGAHSGKIIQLGVFSSKNELLILL